jgi:hypothetical protein
VPAGNIVQNVPDSHLLDVPNFHLLGPWTHGIEKVPR